MTSLSDPQYKQLFKEFPGKILVLTPDQFEIVAVTDEYLRVTQTRESDILGKRLLEMIPDNPADPHADGVKTLSASLQRVKALKVPDVMGVQRYPIALPDGSFEERLWSPVNSPVLNAAGSVEFIMHRVEDVTTIVRDSKNVAPEGAAQAGDALHLQGIILRVQELRHALTKLQEYEARTRTAERMLHLGTWEMQIDTRVLNWSPQVFEIYGIPAADGTPSFDGYFDRAHPDDRANLLATYAAFADNHLPSIEFEHRVLDANGDVRYVKGVGERHKSDLGDVLVGYVQDITAQIKAQRKLSQAERIVQIAGEKARLGGWRVELANETVIWTPETAFIHDQPAGYSPPSVADAIGYYDPVHRELILGAFERCARDGIEYDVVCQLLTPLGKRPWVRVIGIPDRDAAGSITAVQGAFQDISILHEAQARADHADRQRLHVLESISDAFFAVDGDWNVTYLNQQACVLLERSQQELLGKNMWEEFPQAVGSEFQRQYQNAVQTRRTSQFQEFYPPLEKWFDVSAYPMTDGLAVYFRDVTSERLRQEELRLVDAALSRQRDIVMITEAHSLDAPDGPRIVYVNDAFEQVTGFTKDEAIGRTPRLLQGLQTDRSELDRIRNALVNQEAVRAEVVNYTKEGAPYWLEINITPLFDDAGVCTHFVAVHRDVSERKVQENEIRYAKERFELISRATNDVIWDWDFVANKVWWNDSISEVFGYERGQLEPGPESWTQRIHPDDLDRVLLGIHAVIDGSEDRWRDEYRFIKADGESAQVIDRGFVIRDDAGKAIRMLGSMVDITERTDMERRLRESQKMETIGHLTGGVAHDFNNLLTVILGNAEMLAEMVADPKLRPMAEMAHFAAKRGAELTSRLLAFARRQPLAPRLTDINQQVETMRPLIRRTLPEHIGLEFVLAPDLGIAEIDPSELDSALLNLVVNARDAMQDGGKLTVETTNAVLDSDYAEQHLEVAPGDYVMVCVSDTGVGMGPETVSRAFEPFFTTKDAGKGSGLGLSMVFGFAKQSGGHIKIYSEPGEGTSVKLYFPRILDAKQPSSIATVKQGLQGGDEHILIAEDDDLVLKHLDAQLRALGYRVTSTRSGPEALLVLQERSDIDLLLTDIIMPGGMNGRQLADRARATYPALKVLFTSGYSENAIVHHGRLDPGVDLLSKPYSRLELASKVRLVLDKKS
ncbi:PAS domain S-box protein [Acidovorax sp. A1169]|uniref:PAS domain S-box protein n=1 Tax=Acidovorax sp. A1169 TaxID=3059524 RepID=UPI0027377FE7|nr:PAS domain S-box protein [Acidovorax sp. A1169]MDP4077668.1 PAS domain S-box protein [Acidovorax sp. A1169]